MNKQEFLHTLKAKLSGLPQQDITDRLDFYSEMIDDRIEEGMTEEEAVLALGDVDDIVSQIIADTPLTKIVKEKIKPKKRIHAWEIILLALGSPIWLSLLIAFFAVALSLYVVLWSLVISVWAVFASLAACGLAGVVACVIFITQGNLLTGLAILATGFVCAGLGIYLFFVCKAATQGTICLTKNIILAIKRRIYHA